MRDNTPSTTDENQPIDLAGCRFALIPGTTIHLVIPGQEAEARLAVQLGISAGLAAVRADALRALAAGQEEAFGQRNSALGGQLYLSVSLLTDREHWRGGWLLYRCSPGEEERLVQYIEAARNAVVVGLRKERRQRGSKN